MATKISKKDFDTLALGRMSSAERIDFCKSWPTAKIFLQFLKEKINNPLVKGAIEFLIKKADEYFKNNCPVGTKKSGK